MATNHKTAIRENTTIANGMTEGAVAEIQAASAAKAAKPAVDPNTWRKIARSKIRLNATTQVSLVDEDGERHSSVELSGKALGRAWAVAEKGDRSAYKIEVIYDGGIATVDQPFAPNQFTWIDPPPRKERDSTARVKDEIEQALDLAYKAVVGLADGKTRDEFNKVGQANADQATWREFFPGAHNAGNFTEFVRALHTYRQDRLIKAMEAVAANDMAGYEEAMLAYLRGNSMERWAMSVAQGAGGCPRKAKDEG